MNRILVASDLGQSSANALARAIRLASEHSAAMMIVHAMRANEGDDSLEVRRKICAEGRIMDDEMTDRQIEIIARVSVTPPADAILCAAEDFDVDLIVLGGHGRVRFRDAVFGTTGTHVVRHGQRPVLIVQKDAAVPYDKAIAAIDAVETGPGILGIVRETPKCELFAVHAFKPTFASTTGFEHPVAEELALEKLLGAYRGNGPTARVSGRLHAIVEPGDAMRVIMDETAALQPDLLAMGTRSHAAFLGSHAVDALFGCPSDLLVVHERQCVPA